MKHYDVELLVIKGDHKEEPKKNYGVLAGTLDPHTLVMAVDSLLANKHTAAVLDIPHDEPIFVLRAQDQFALSLIKFWLEQTEACVNSGKFLKASVEYQRFEEWQKKHLVKIPD